MYEIFLNNYLPLRWTILTTINLPPLNQHKIILKRVFNEINLYECKFIIAKTFVKLYNVLQNQNVRNVITNNYKLLNNIIIYI